MADATDFVGRLNVNFVESQTDPTQILVRKESEDSEDGNIGYISLENLIAAISEDGQDLQSVMENGSEGEVETDILLRKLNDGSVFSRMELTDQQAVLRTIKRGIVASDAGEGEFYLTQDNIKYYVPNKEVDSTLATLEDIDEAITNLPVAVTNQVNMACVVRLYEIEGAPGTYEWRFVPEGGSQNHTHIYANSVTTPNGYSFIVGYPEVDGVGSVVVVPDETYAEYGLFTGGSVSKTGTTVQFFKNGYSIRVSRTAGVFAMDADATAIVLPSQFTFTFSGTTGLLRIAHSALPFRRADDIILTKRDGSLLTPVIVSKSTTDCFIKFLDSSGNQVMTASDDMDFNMTRTGVFRVANVNLYNTSANWWILGTHVKNGVAGGAFDYPIDTTPAVDSESLITSGGTYAADLATLAAANTHADTGDATTLASANTYTDSLVSLVFRAAGNWDASANTFPTTGTGTAGAIRRGDTYRVSVAGNPFGGAEVLDIGDSFYAMVSTPGQTASNWAKFESNTAEASPSYRGTMKKYTTTGSNTDGTMTQLSITTELAGKVPLSVLGVNSGVATLDAGGKLLTTQVPQATASLIGGVKLYTGSGANTDGTITQAGIATLLGGKQDAISGNGYAYWTGSSFVWLTGVAAQYVTAAGTVVNFATSTRGVTTSDSTTSSTQLVIGTTTINTAVSLLQNQVNLIKRGALTLTGTGAATAFTIPHGHTTTPTYCNVVPKNAAAAGISFTTWDATNITINYSVAPAAGTNNLSVAWTAMV